MAAAPLSARFLRDVKAAPIGLDERSVRVAFVDPLEAYPIQALSVAYGRPVRPYVGARGGHRGGAGPRLRRACRCSHGRRRHRRRRHGAAEGPGQRCTRHPRGEPADLGRRGEPGVGHPPGAERECAAGAAARRWGDARSRPAARLHALGGGVADQGDGGAEHRRAPPAPGRPRPAHRARPRRGHPGGHLAHHPWRERGDAPARPLPLDAGLRRAGLRRRTAGAAEADAGPAPRHPAGHRPYRLGQDHHALRRPVGAERTRPQAADHRGSDRIPAGRGEPDPGRALHRPRPSPPLCDRSCARTPT